MTFEIEVNGRTRAVSIERLKHDGGAGVPDARLVRVGVAAGAAFRVIVDGTPHLVDAVRVDAGALSFIQLDGEQSDRAKAGGLSHRVAISDGASGELTLALANGVVRATVNGRRSRRGGEVAGAAGEQRIVAPMPGKVLRVLVQPGQDVAARQPLVVIEAMKMENELSSPRAGRVKDVVAVEGQSVEAGRVLIIVE